MTAECRLLEEARNELVVLDDVNVLFLEGSFTSALFHAKNGVQIARARAFRRIGIVIAMATSTTVRFFFVRHL